MAFFITGLLLLNLKPIPASSTTSTTSPVVAQLNVAVVSVEVATTTTGVAVLLDQSTPSNDGAMVTAVLTSSPAAAVLRRGDIITMCNTAPVHGVADLDACTQLAGSSGEVRLHLARHGTPIVTTVRLRSQP